MLFVMYGTNGSVPIRDPSVRKIADANGNLQTIIDRPVYLAHFRPQAMTETQRVVAVRQFTLRNPQNPYGAALPYSTGDIMGQEFSTEDVMPGSTYSGFDPAFSLSRFDTREDIPYEEQGAHTEKERAELKTLTEEVLLRPEKGLGRDYLRIDDSLPKPWATYPDDNGQGVSQEIIATARKIGVSMETIIEFEKTQDKPKSGVISMAEAEIEAAREAAREAAALGTEIPA